MSPVVSLNVISSDLGPTVRDQRLYKFLGDQLYRERGELNVEKKEGAYHARQGPTDRKHAGVAHLYEYA